MSAFVCSHAHFNAIVTHANRLKCFSFGAGIPSTDDPEALGQFLLNANVASVNHRYRATDAPAEFKWRPSRAKVLTPIAFIKALNCLEYQSCELPDWEGSAAARAINQMRAEAISLLPGYRDAEWALA